MASYVEARLINIAAYLAIPQVNGVRPFGLDGLHLSADLEQLVADALFLLAVAGFRRFEDPLLTEADRPVRLAATGDLDDVLVVIQRQPRQLRQVPSFSSWSAGT